MTAESFPEIYRQILTEHDPRLSAAAWRRTFEWPWPNPEDHVGMAMADDTGRVVAFVGLIYSRQRVGEHVELFCNVSSWFARDGHGSSALALIMPLLRRKDVTITNLTSIASVYSIFERFGFGALETHTRVSLPPTCVGPRRYRVFQGGTIPLDRLSGVEKAVLSDHRDCGHPVLVEGPRGMCLFLYTVGRRKRLRTARVHYLSDPAVFADALPSIHRNMLGRAIVLVECDDRLLRGEKSRFSVRVPLAIPRLFRSSVCKPEDVSNAYSEMILLNL